MEGIFEKQWQLNFTQCYSNGAIKYSELNNLLQLTASEHAEQIGFGYQAMLAQRQSWVLSRMRIEIQRLPQYTQTVTIRTWIKEFEGNRTIRDFQVELNGEIICTASSLWVVFNLATRRADWLALSTDHILYLPEIPSTKKPVDKIELKQEFSLMENYEIRLSDLDIAQHANNVKYMEWCFDAMAIEQVLGQTIDVLEMNYLKELKFQDTVQILQTSLSKGTRSFALEKEGKTHFLMRIHWNKPAAL